MICEDKVSKIQGVLGNKPAALKEGIIVAAKANQKPPIVQVIKG